MRKAIIFLLIFVIAFSIFSGCALAAKDPIISPEKDPPVDPPPDSPQTGYAFEIGAVVAALLLFGGIAFVAIRKVHC